MPQGSTSMGLTPVAPLTGERLAGADMDRLARPSITEPESRHPDSTVPRSLARPAAMVVANWSAGIVCAAVFLELLARALTSNLSLLDRPSPTASYSPNA